MCRRRWSKSRYPTRPRRAASPRAGRQRRAAGCAADQAIRHGRAGGRALRVPGVGRRGLDDRRGAADRRWLDAHTLIRRLQENGYDDKVTRPCGMSRQRKTPCTAIRPARTEWSWCCRAAARSAPTRPASIRRCIEDGIKPDWVIGTSIGAINAALIAGNKPENRLARLQEFWDTVEQAAARSTCSGRRRSLATRSPTWTRSCAASPASSSPIRMRCSASNTRSASSAHPTTRPIRCKRDADRAGRLRLSQRAPHAADGRRGQRPHQRDALFRQPRRWTSAPAHVMASGALPPAFPAVCIDGEPYWDGGIYSNTPIEVVLDERPRRRLADLRRQHVAAARRRAEVDLAGDGSPEGHPIRKPRQEPHRAAGADPPPAPRHPRAVQAHPADQQDDPKVKELASYGCGTMMHLVRLLVAAPRRRGPHQGHRFHALPASARAGRPATSTANACSRKNRGNARSTCCRESSCTSPGMSVG